ncbi:Uncharacterized protein OBRU01_01611, partial [Operophtera brumata]
MFQAIEGDSEIERVNNMTLERNNMAQYLWQNTKIVNARRLGWDGGRSSRQWSFSSAFLYSLTVITTIGYGHLSPKTNWGKVTTVLYALLGMPLFLLYLSNVGELLARWFKCLYALVCLCRGCPGFTRRRVIRMRPQIEISEAESIERPAHWHSQYSESDVTPEYESPQYHRGLPRRADYLRSISMPAGPPRPTYLAPPHMGPPRGWSLPAERESDVTSDFSVVTFDAQTITVPISLNTEVVTCVLVFSYLIFGSMLFGMWEKWDQLDGAYFCFISLSSIGFGDFVPGERVYTARIQTSFIACSLYLMLGMALVAMCFNLMQTSFIACSLYLMLGMALVAMCFNLMQFNDCERVYTARIQTSFIACSLYLMLGMALVAMCFNLMQVHTLIIVVCMFI